MDLNSITILTLAFAAGLLHALDADHVMAVTAIASRKLGIRAIVRLCLSWSLGHGAVLFIAGGLILILGLNIPHELSHYAEMAVAVVLIVIGSWILKDLYQSHAHIHFHRHDGLSNHAHWHVDDLHKSKFKLSVSKPHSIIKVNNKIKHQHDHRAVMVGVVHGFAGLAPLLAVIPIANQPVWLGVVYLLIFCSGVFLSMLIFGGVLGQLLERLQGYGVLSINVIRGMVGLASISLGVVWLS